MTSRRREDVSFVEGTVEVHQSRALKAVKMLALCALFGLLHALVPGLLYALLGLPCPFVFGLLYALVFGLLHTLVPDLLYGLVFNLLYGLVFSLLHALVPVLLYALVFGLLFTRDLARKPSNASREKQNENNTLVAGGIFNNAQGDIHINSSGESTADRGK